MGSYVSCTKKDKKDGKPTRANMYVKKEGEVEEEEIIPDDIVLTHKEVSHIMDDDDDDNDTDEVKDTKDIANYCLGLLRLTFCGQTTVAVEGHTDASTATDVLNLGLYLSLLDKFLRKHEVLEFTGEEEEYLQLLRLVAVKRHGETEDTEDCYERLLKDSKRFVKIYHDRGVKSELLKHKGYWGSRQQLLSAKVIADYVDKENGPLDPLFAVLLQPTTGRVGPGDTGWFHNMLFDDKGHMAYHSAVHDAFGYLINFHKTGPGYDYMRNTCFFKKNNPLSGQLGGIGFWKKVLHEVETKQRVIHYMQV